MTEFPVFTDQIPLKASLAIILFIQIFHRLPVIAIGVPLSPEMKLGQASRPQVNHPGKHRPHSKTTCILVKYIKWTGFVVYHVRIENMGGIPERFVDLTGITQTRQSPLMILVSPGVFPVESGPGRILVKNGFPYGTRDLSEIIDMLQQQGNRAAFAVA